MPADYRARGLSFAPARPEDDAILRQLLRDNPMEGWVRLGLEREPGYQAGAELAGPCRTVLARDEASGEPVGMYACSGLPVYLNGEAAAATYLGGLRVAPAWRHKIRILKAGYASIPPLALADLPAACFTSIARDNLPARRLLEAGLPGLPRYTSLGELATLALPTGRRPAPAGWQLRPARPDDIPALVRLQGDQARAWQYAPRLAADWLAGLDGSLGLGIGDFLVLEQGGAISGALALWDQRAVKQTVVHGYRFPLDRLRPVYNLWARLTGGLSLPPPGGSLAQVFLAFAAWPAETDAALALLDGALARVREEKGGRAGILGLAAAHPLLPAILQRYRPRVYVTRVESVRWPHLPAPEPDGRPPQPEVALL